MESTVVQIYVTALIVTSSNMTFDTIKVPGDNNKKYNFENELAIVECSQESEYVRLPNCS